PVTKCEPGEKSVLTISSPKSTPAVLFGPQNEKTTQTGTPRECRQVHFVTGEREGNEKRQCPPCGRQELAGANGTASGDQCHCPSLRSSYATDRVRIRVRMVRTHVRPGPRARPAPAVLQPRLPPASVRRTPARCL